MALIHEFSIFPPPIKGLKLLTKMGWKGEGHGLGKDQQGIAKPIEVGEIRERSGIGHHINYYDEYMEEMVETEQQTTTKSTSGKIHPKDTVMQATRVGPSAAAVPVGKPAQKRFRNEFRLNIQKLLKNFIASVIEEDLVFEKGLTNEERAVIHKEAARFGVKTKSQGHGDNRFLVAQKRRTSGELMESIKRNGGQFSKYELISQPK